MESRRTEFVQLYDESLPSGKGCRTKKRKKLDEDDDEQTGSGSTSSEPAASSSRKSKKGNAQKTGDVAILKAAEEQQEEKVEKEACSGCAEYSALKAKYKALRKEKKQLESELEHFKNVCDAGDLVRSLKDLCKSMKDKSVHASSSSSSSKSEGSRSSAPDNVENETDSMKVDGAQRGAECMASPTCKIKEGVKVDIGHGVMVNKTSLLGLTSTAKTATVFARKLMSLVFTDAEMVGKSLTGKKSNAHKDAEVREGLDPLKIEAICGLTKRKFPGTETGAVKSSMANKLKELRKKAVENDVPAAQGKKNDEVIANLLGEANSLPLDSN